MRLGKGVDGRSVQFEATDRHAEMQRRVRKVALASWNDWFRQDFLRSCFVGACLAWDGLGAIQVRYVLDPWYPGQGAAPTWVYGVMVAFVILSLIGQVFLYRRWWPSEEARLRGRTPRTLWGFLTGVGRKRQ